MSGGFKVGDLLSIYLDEETVGTQKANMIKSSVLVGNLINGSLLWQVKRIINPEQLSRYRMSGHFLGIPIEADLYVEINLQLERDLDTKTKELFESAGYSGEPYVCHGYITSMGKYIPSYNKPLSHRIRVRDGMFKPNIFETLQMYFQLDNSKCWSVRKHIGIRFPELGETLEQSEVKQIIEALNGVWEDHLHDDALNLEGSEYAWRGNMAKSFFFKDLWENGYIEGMFDGEYREGNPVYDNIKKYVYNQGLDEGFMPENVEGVLPPTGGGRKKRRKRRKTKTKKSKKRKSKKKKSKKK